MVAPTPLEQIRLADVNASGIILCKGAPSLNDDEAERKIVPAWGLFGLQLLADATVNAFATNGSDEEIFNNRSTQKLPPDTWTLVTLVQSREKAKLYFNSSCVAETATPKSLLSPGKGKVTMDIESPHPYADNSDIYKPVEIPGALKLTITFDGNSRTENSYDYIRFYKDDRRESHWGESQYMGGRGGGSR